MIRKKVGQKGFEFRAPNRPKVRAPKPWGIRKKRGGVRGPNGKRIFGPRETENETK